MRKLILSILVCTSCTIFAQDVVNDVKEKAIEAVEEKVKTVVENKVESVTNKAAKAVGSASVAKTQDKTTFYLITNGEKKAPSEKYPDPYLSDAGKKTADKWVKVLANIKFDAVFAQEFISAKQTAQIIGTPQKLGIYQFETENMYDESFKYATTGKNVLIVADDATLVKFANTVLGNSTLTTSKEANYSNLYIVSNTKEVKDVIVLNVN